MILCRVQAIRKVPACLDGHTSAKDGKRTPMPMCILFFSEVPNSLSLPARRLASRTGSQTLILTPLTHATSINRLYTTALELGRLPRTNTRSLPFCRLLEYLSALYCQLRRLWMTRACMTEILL